MHLCYICSIYNFLADLQSERDLCYFATIQLDNTLSLVYTAATIILTRHTGTNSKHQSRASLWWERSAYTAFIAHVRPPCKKNKIMGDVSFPAFKIQKKDETCLGKTFSVYPFLRLSFHFLKLNMEQSRVVFLKMILKWTYFCKILPLSTFKYSFHALKNLNKGNLFLVLLRWFFEQSYSQAWGCRELCVNLLSLLLGFFFQVDNMLHGARWGEKDEVFPGERCC